MEFLEPTTNDSSINTSASSNFLPFLEDTLAKFEGKKVGLIRMDSEFYSNQIMSHLEAKNLNYVIVCLFSNRLKHQLAYEKNGSKSAMVWTLPKALFEA